MTSIADLVGYLEKIAPIRLAESWDNVGLLTGDPDAPCHRVMTCLTLTSEVAEEAIAGRADLVVTHHPVLFRPVQSIRADRRETAVVWRLARAGVAIYSAHTAFDNTANGINKLIADRIGLSHLESLQDRPGEPRFKIVAFCPREAREQVVNAAFVAGAGRIGAYSECSYSGPGIGTFRGDESTNPTIGQQGRREAVREWRVELLCPANALADVLEAIRQAHTYETPAIDVYPNHPSPDLVGVGRIGTLHLPMPLKSLVDHVATALSTRQVQFAGNPERMVHRIAIVCGAGDDFIAAAAHRGADVLITGEARYHRAIEAIQIGVGLILAGHHATERPGVETLADRLASEVAEIEVWASRVETDPLRVIEPRPGT